MRHRTIWMGISESSKWSSATLASSTVLQDPRHVWKTSTGCILTFFAASSPPLVLWMNSGACCWYFEPFASGCYLMSQELPAHRPLESIRKQSRSFIRHSRNLDSKTFPLSTFASVAHHSFSIKFEKTLLHLGVFLVIVYSVKQKHT